MVKGEMSAFRRYGNPPKHYFIKMKVMLFIDLENFKESLWEINPDRQPNFKKCHFFLFDYIIQKFSWEKFCPQFIRAYIYTGEYTDSIISKIKQELIQFKEDGEEYKKIKDFIDKIIKRKNAQESVLKFTNYCDFFEVKKTPLHYTPNEAIKGKGIFQKGIDVQLAVDLVSHAYQDNYDVAIICSGDIDLLESLKLIKMLGKIAILVSHSSLISGNMIKESDYFCRLDKFNEQELNEISNILNREQ